MFKAPSPLPTDFCIGTFGTDENRTKDNMHACQLLAVDIDCNHPKDLPSVTDEETGELVIKRKAYPSAKAAALVLQKFCEDTGLSALGDPWLVHSGGGLHAYWPLDQVLFKEDWYPLARRFKELCFKHGLAIDPAITSDASRILRVPDTTNTGLKNGKAVRGQTKVRGISEGDRFSVDDIDAILTAEGFGKEFVKPAPTSSSLALAGHRPTSVNSSPSSLSKALTQNSVTTFKKILIKTRDGAGCAQLQSYIENADEDGMEPVWRGLLSWAKVCGDGEKAAVWLSDLHPYDHERMHRKLAEIKGPYSCAAMDDAMPGICRNCQHWGKVTSSSGNLVDHGGKVLAASKTYAIYWGTASAFPSDLQSGMAALLGGFGGAGADARLAAPLFLRCHRAHGRRRLDRHDHRLAAVPLRQGRRAVLRHHQRPAQVGAWL